MSLPTNINQLGNAEAPWMKWDLDKWKEEVQHRTENLPPFLRTPEAIKNATSLNYFFTDAATPVNYYKGDALPDWEYTSATNCDNFNRGNTSTVIGSLNAPNCTSAKNAFNGCTNMTELREKVINVQNIEQCFYGTKLQGTYEFHNLTRVTYAFMHTAGTGGLKVKLYGDFPQHSANYTFLSSTALGHVEIFASNIFFCGDTFQSAINLKSVFIWSPNNIIFDNCVWGFAFSGCASLQVIYSNLRHRASDMGSIFSSCRKLTQLIFAFDKSFPRTGTLANAFNNIKLDLPTIKLLSDPIVGLSAQFAQPSVIMPLGISRYKLAKDTSQEAREKYPLFFSYPVADATSTLGYKEQDFTEEEIALYNVGKTKFDENDNLLYVKDRGGETTSQSEAVLNSYILTSTEGKTDISTVEDVSSFTDEDWNNHYGYPPASGTMYYATGPLLKALRTITDRGWNITVQYN